MLVPVPVPVHLEVQLPLVLLPKLLVIPNLIVNTDFSFFWIPLRGIAHFSSCGLLCKYPRRYFCQHSHTLCIALGYR